MKPHDHIGEEPCFTAIIDGLTKRELFAIMVLQGFMASKVHSTHFNPVHDATYCIGIADALIAELQK